MTTSWSDAIFEAMDPPPPRAKGWWVLSWPDFQQQFDRLVAMVEVLREKDPAGYHSHPKTKLLHTLLRLVTEHIPRDPASAEFRQEGTLGSAHTGWYRAKFHGRYRLFFRFDSRRKVLVHAWVNTESGLRKAGDRNDPYAVFRRMLERGTPPASFDDLLRESKGLRVPSEDSE